MTQQHVMLDIETWSKKPNATIISIGAVKFDPFDLDGPFENFHVAIDPSASQESFRKLFDIDPDTIRWWMDPARDEARQHWLAMTKLDLATVLVGFAEWYGPESLPTWGNGATFDNVIVSTAFELAGMPRPWHFEHDRCYRTLKNLCPGSLPEVGWMRKRFGADIGVAHTALYDAQRQAVHLREMLLQQKAGQAMLERAEAERRLGPADAPFETTVDIGTALFTHVPDEAHAPDALHDPVVADEVDIETAYGIGVGRRHREIAVEAFESLPKNTEPSWLSDDELTQRAAELTRREGHANAGRTRELPVSEAFYLQALRSEIARRGLGVTADDPSYDELDHDPDLSR